MSSSISDTTVQCLFEVLTVKKESAKLEAKYQSEIEVIIIFQLLCYYF